MKNYNIPTTTCETIFAGSLVCTSPNDGKGQQQNPPGGGGKENAPQRVGTLYI